MSLQSSVKGPRRQSMNIRPLIKYIGNKHRFAEEIIASFPKQYGTYYEPFAGSLAVLGHLRPRRSVACDALRPLIDMWRLVKERPAELVDSYRANWLEYRKDKLGTYERVKARYNSGPNPHDFLFISRTCYGGVMRFRKKDGYISTPIGPHDAISPESFAARLEVWHGVVKNTEFVCCDFEEVVNEAKASDIVYCDPPYFDTQRIIYGAQAFTLERLFGSLVRAKSRGAFAVLSIDGTKKSGDKTVAITPPPGLFEIEAFVSLGGSMLKRFWRDGQDVQDERVRDRLLISSGKQVPQPDLFAAD